MTDHREIIIREGWPVILFFLILSLAGFFWAEAWIAALLAVITFFVIWFFRNPERVASPDEKAVLAPADGRVIRIEDISGKSHELLTAPATKVSIFMNVFNVHVNRVPYAGVVRSVSYKKGRFLSADLDKASALNERNTVVIGMDDGREIMTVQIAGLIARRIVCWVQEGTRVSRGERFGLIRFGSRLEVFLPPGTHLLVSVGDRVKAGVTPLGRLT